MTTVKPPQPRTRRPSLQEMLQASPYQDYVYSYPHKTAYRSIDPPVPLETLWSEQNRQALYVD